jgi:hypothetical protein
VRKFLVAWLAALMLLATLVIPAAAKGPKCADLQSMSADGLSLSRASWDGASGDVNGRFFLEGPSCEKVTYTLFIIDDEGSTALIGQSSVAGDGVTPSVDILVSGVAAEDGDVCAWVESTRGKQTLDRAPADGCVILLDDGTSPAGGKGF